MRRASMLLPMLFLLCALVAQNGSAADAVPTEMDPVKAKRAVKLADKLRCLVCQNQTIADSNAELANDLRGQIREQIAGGRTDDEILTYMVDRYGDFVLYDPPFKATTVLLWAGPALLLLGGLFILLRNLRRQPAAEAPLTDEERERAKRLLDGDDGKVDT
ncbi:MAG: cytochrome c-type biogenesis protein [Casimicrobiaceae bacterium]